MISLAISNFFISQAKGPHGTAKTRHGTCDGKTDVEMEIEKKEAAEVSTSL